MPHNLLPVPHLRQETPHSCLETCARMVLAYLGESVTEEQLLALFEGTEFGTPANRLTRLERMSYSVDIGPSTLELIRSKLESRLPSITLVNTAFLNYWHESTRHAVVVIGINSEHVYLNDPAFPSAPQTASLDSFLAAWIEMEQISATISRATR